MYYYNIYIRMFSNQKLEKELLRLYQSDKNFIHRLLDLNLGVPLLSKDKNNNTLLHNMILDKDFTQPPKAMPDEYKVKDVIQSYRNYYIGAKKDFVSWKNREVPYWFCEENNLELV